MIEREKSIVMHGCAEVAPRRRTPAHLAMQGTRIPPSKRLPLKPEKGKLQLVLLALLSLVKITRVGRIVGLLPALRSVLCPRI